MSYLLNNINVLVVTRDFVETVDVSAYLLDQGKYPWFVELEGPRKYWLQPSPTHQLIYAREEPNSKWVM